MYAERLVKKEPSAPVVNQPMDDAAQQKQQKPKKKVYRSDYTVAKKSARELFEKFDKSGVFNTIPWEVGCPLKFFLKHVIFFMERYTVEKFQHDLADDMVTIMSDLRIVRACREYKLCLFDVAQTMAWENNKVRANITKLGIKNVNAFADGNSWASKRDLLVFSMDELAPYFEQLGLERSDYDQNFSKKQEQRERA